MIISTKKSKEAKMNSSASSPSHGSSTECVFVNFLGGRLDHSSAEAYAVLLSVITCPITTVLNALVVFVVGTKPRLKTESNVALACLATTDGIMGAIGQPLFIAQITSVLQEETSNVNCSVIQLAKYNLMVLGTSSLFHLTLINLERYIAIKQSFAYVTIVTKSRILCSSALAWIVSLLLTVPLPIIDNYTYLAVSNITASLFIAIIVYCQVVLYFAIRRHEKQIAAQQVSVEARQKFLKDKKAFRLTTTVVVILLLTYLPLVVVRILIVKSALNFVNVTYIAFFTAVFMAVLNSLINPVICCVRIREFRAAFIEVVCRKSNAQAGEIEMQVFGSLNSRETRQNEEGQQREEGQHNEQGNSQNTGNNNDSDNNNNIDNNNNSNNSSNGSNNNPGNNSSEDNNNHNDDDDNNNSGDRGSINSNSNNSVGHNDDDDNNNEERYININNEIN